MFGLTFEKLLLVAVVAGLVIGPQRLPHYAQQFSQTIRGLKNMLESARATTENDLGFALARTEWNAFDPRHYDPRRIVRDALADAPPTTAIPKTVISPEILAEAERVRPGQKYLVTGSSAHPRRISIESLPAEDPRRLAAQIEELDIPRVTFNEPGGE